MYLNLSTIDRSGALQDGERWLLEQIPIQKENGWIRKIREVQQALGLERKCLRYEYQKIAGVFTKQRNNILE